MRKGTKNFSYGQIIFRLFLLEIPYGEKIIPSGVIFFSYGEKKFSYGVFKRGICHVEFAKEGGYILNNI